MKYAIATIAFVALSSAAPLEQRGDAPSGFKIANIVYGGSGCPQGSLDIDWTDSRVLPIRFSKEFTARVGAKADITDARKNCQLNLKLQYDPGFSYSVFQNDISGWADLDNGVTGTIKSTYYFSGQADSTSSALEIDGPYHGKYYKSDDLAIAKWSPCGSESLLNVNSEVLLSPIASNLNGVLAATRDNARFTSNIYVAWKKC